jgi:integrase/recombinase XerD
MQLRHPQPTARDHPFAGTLHRNAVACWLGAHKKTTKTAIGYLEKSEIDALLDQPDPRTSLRARDYAPLLFLYNNGARADEAAKLSVGNPHMSASPSVRLHGKGNKFRTCPLWPKTATSLSCLVAGRDKNDAVFLSRVNQPLTRCMQG